MKVTVLAHTPNPETLIAKCASTCYDSIPKELDAARKMIKAIINTQQSHLKLMALVVLLLMN